MLTCLHCTQHLHVSRLLAFTALMFKTMPFSTHHSSVSSLPPWVAFQFFNFCYLFYLDLYTYVSVYSSFSEKKNNCVILKKISKNYVKKNIYRARSNQKRLRNFIKINVIFFFTFTSLQARSADLPASPAGLLGRYAPSGFALRARISHARVSRFALTKIFE